jgi:hypothetical protein
MYNIAARTMKGKAQHLSMLRDEEVMATISHTSWSQTTRVKKKHSHSPGFH